MTDRSDNTGHVARGFKLFGLQRTCTNLMRRAMIDSFLVDSLEIGWEWKHGPIGPVARHRHNGRFPLIVVCVRNPYAWIESCFRYFSQSTEDTSHCPNFQRDWDLPAFVAHAHYEFENPVDRWNRMNHGYLDWLARHPERGTLVRSEDLLGRRRQRDRLRKMEAEFGLTRRAVKLSVFDVQIDGLAEPTESPMRVAFFENEEYLDRYDAGSLDFVNQQIDGSLMDALGYARRAGGDRIVRAT